jgi:integrase
LRGLTWKAIDFGKSELHVTQRADAKLTIGPPKSESGARTVPLPSNVVNTLKEWKDKCPVELVFPTNTERLIITPTSPHGHGPDSRVMTADGKAKYHGCTACGTGLPRGASLDRGGRQLPPWCRRGWATAPSP